MQALIMNTVHMGRKATLTLSTPVGTWLRSARDARGWTLETLAEEAGTAAAVVSNLERGQRNPSRDMIRKLGTALGVSVEHKARLIDEGLIAAGFSPENATYQVMTTETLTPDQRTMLDLMERDPIAAARLLLDRATATQQSPSPVAASEFDVAPDPSIRPNLKPSGYAPSPADEAALKARMAEEFKEKQRH